MPNLGFYLSESADRYPDSVALRCDGVITTYSQLTDSVCRFAEFLVRQGIRPGDRVGVMLPNRPEFVVVFYSVLHEGAVAVPMNPFITPGKSHSSCPTPAQRRCSSRPNAPLPRLPVRKPQACALWPSTAAPSRT